MLLAKDRRGIVERVAALMSILLLVPVLRRRRAKHEDDTHRHLPLLGH